ncbi:hypothetical protein TWF569_001747 [Orbilia oligospora]|uniref:Uncharacterized protein n=1 Tax=Orbilia oligospora TaxID=2813651 RepID=A0A7C8J3M4_ORBOL|nr:hypothetical protein TWF102_008642 [Orbilia oligospora]KAF3105285.1 hypothetical protein TWF103_006741 [Orbilia oligospora]KAF3123376.1 hypothetical protein TWF569_001747 [Orbilia oligospora]
MPEYASIYVLSASFLVGLPFAVLLYAYINSRRSPKSNHDGTLCILEEKSPNLPPAYPLKSYTLAQITYMGPFPCYGTLTGVPLPEPYHAFDIKTAKPRPYRPFRWAYHQTMSLTRLEPNWWLELEDTYSTRLLQRSQILQKYKTKIIDRHLDISNPWRVEVACKELMEMVIQFLCSRYPQYFHFDTSKFVFLNRILGREFEVYKMDPLDFVFQNVPEDFAIVMPDDGRGGKYVFVAGMICSSVGWDLGEKIGKVLGEIHGVVPEYQEKMERGMDRYFSKLTTDKPIQRGSWDIVVGEPLFVCGGEEFNKRRSGQDHNIKEEDLTLRVDWQTLRRLPLSGGIVFNYKALFTPVKEFEDEPGVPALVEKVLREGNKKILEYKGTWHVEHVVLPMLERMRRRQVEMGVWEEGMQVRTLEESPFYRGWEEKWRKQQGF